MKLAEFLIKNFGWTEEETIEKQNVLAKISFKSEESFWSKVEMFKRLYHLSTNDVARIIKIIPPVIGLSESVLIEKNKFLMQNFKFSKSKLENIIKTQPQILAHSKQSITTTANYYISTFNISNDEFIKMINRFPNLLTYSTSLIDSKLKFYQKTLNLTPEQFLKMFKTMPSIISYSEDLILSKIQFLKTKFNLSQKEVENIIITQPALIGYAENSIASKVEYYKLNFGLSDKEISAIIKKQPNLFSFSIDNLNLKKVQLDKLNITADELVAQPSIMTVPANSLAVRYMLLRFIASREEILKKHGWFMQTAQKSYARICGLANEKSIKLSHIVADETKFKKRFNLDSNELMNEYKLTNEIVRDIEKTYNNFVNIDELLALSDKEIDFIK